MSEGCQVLFSGGTSAFPIVSCYFEISTFGSYYKRQVVKVFYYLVIFQKAIQTNLLICRITMSILFWEELSNSSNSQLRIESQFSRSISEKEQKLTSQKRQDLNLIDLPYWVHSLLGEKITSGETRIKCSHKFVRGFLPTNFLQQAV